MNREIKIVANGLLAVIVTVLFTACGSRAQPGMSQEPAGDRSL